MDTATPASRATSCRVTARCAAAAGRAAGVSHAPGCTESGNSGKRLPYWVRDDAETTAPPPVTRLEPPGLAGLGGRRCSATCSPSCSARTLGVAGLDAAERFAIDPGTLSAFVFIQVAVYIAAQIPAGLLVDRFGSRAMLVVSGGAAGRGPAAAGRSPPRCRWPCWPGCWSGPATRSCSSPCSALVPRWFPARRVPVFAQLTGMLCQFGQVLSAVPFAALLHAAGWTTAFAVAAAVSALVAVPGLRRRAQRPGRALGRRRRRCRRARSAGSCARCGSGPAPGWASSATWAPSSR